MNHEALRALAALSVYEELEAEEQQLLEGHLRSCGDCRELAGAVASLPGRDELTVGESPLPDVDRLWAAVSSPPNRSWIRRAVPASSFAAGVLLTLLLRGNGDEARGDVPQVESPQRFAATDAPEPAPTRGRLGRLAELRTGR